MDDVTRLAMMLRLTRRFGMALVMLAALGGTALATALGSGSATTTLADPVTFARASGAALWVAVGILAVATLTAWGLDRASGRPENRQPHQPTQEAPCSFQPS